MRTLKYAVVGFAIGFGNYWLGYFQGSYYGESRGRRQATLYSEGMVAARVDQRVAGFRRVQEIREKAAYRKGWDKCVDALALPQSEY